MKPIFFIIAVLLGISFSSVLFLAFIAKDQAGRQTLLNWLSHMKRDNALQAENSDVAKLLVQQDEAQVLRLGKLRETLRDELDVIERSSSELKAVLAQLQQRRHLKNEHNNLYNSKKQFSNATLDKHSNTPTATMEDHHKHILRERERLVAQDNTFKNTIADLQSNIKLVEQQLSINSLFRSPSQLNINANSNHFQHSVSSNKAPFIFAITTGRTGTKLFQQVLNSAKNVNCFHERHPLMSHDYLRLPLHETYHERMAVKVGAIAGVLDEWRFPSNTSYCDTSNYFAKSWWDVALDSFADDRPFKILVIRRHMAAIVKSMVDLNWFGGIGRECGKFLYSVNSNISIIQPSAPDVELDRFDKAIGHVFDVEAKAQMLIERYAAHRNVEFYHVCLEQLLTSPTAPTDLLSFIGLTPTHSTSTILEEAETNSRVDKKRENLTTIEYVEQRIAQFQQLYADNDWWLPTAPHVNPQFCQQSLHDMQLMFQ